MDTMQGVHPEWIILADAAEVVNSKLYLLGGGWDRLVINTGFPAQHRLAVALSFSVPWNETNIRHQFEVEVQDEDARSLLKAGGHFEVGRPPGIPVGQAQRFQLALNATLQFERPGTFVVIPRVEGEEVGRANFSVLAGPGLATRP